MQPKCDDATMDKELESIQEPEVEMNVEVDVKSYVLKLVDTTGSTG